MRDVMNEIAFAFDDVNATQDALMAYFEKTSKWENQIKDSFSSDRKYRAIAFEEEGNYVLGAPEFLVKDNKELNEKVDACSRDGMRVLLLGKCSGINMTDMSVSGVEPSGLIVISDCIRPEARGTFEYFASQNVDIKVISGDNPVTFQI